MGNRFIFFKREKKRDVSLHRMDGLLGKKIYHTFNESNIYLFIKRKKGLFSMKKTSHYKHHSCKREEEQCCEKDIIIITTTPGPKVLKEEEVLKELEVYRFPRDTRTNR